MNVFYFYSQGVVKTSLKRCQTTKHCGDSCWRISKPTCGSDRKLYHNGCAMKMKNCGWVVFFYKLHNLMTYIVISDKQHLRYFCLWTTKPYNFQYIKMNKAKVYDRKHWNKNKDQDFVYSVHTRFFFVLIFKDFIFSRNPLIERN